MKLDPKTQELVDSMMWFDEFSMKHPIAGRALIKMKGPSGVATSVLPDGDDHCIWSAMIEYENGDCRMAIYVASSHPHLFDQGLPGPAWVWEGDL